jgi:hypothetical protein
MLTCEMPVDVRTGEPRTLRAGREAQLGEFGDGSGVDRHGSQAGR